MLTSSHGTKAALKGCVFTSWGQAILADDGAAVHMHDCTVRDDATCGINGMMACGKGTRVAMVGVKFQSIGDG